MYYVRIVVGAAFDYRQPFCAVPPVFARRVYPAGPVVRQTVPAAGTVCSVGRCTDGCMVDVDMPAVF